MCKDNSFFNSLSHLPTFFCNFAANLQKVYNAAMGKYLNIYMDFPKRIVNS